MDKVIKCNQCPSGCATCKLEDLKNINSSLLCLTCQLNFNLNGNNCKALCSNSEYYNPVATECTPCHFSCLTCTSAGNTGCLGCAKGFNFDTKKICIEQTTSVLDTNCGISAVYSVS